MELKMSLQIYGVCASYWAIPDGTGCHRREFTDYFQESKWRLSDNLVVLIAAQVSIQSHARFPGKKRGGDTLEMKAVAFQETGSQFESLFAKFEGKETSFRRCQAEVFCSYYSEPLG